MSREGRLGPEFVSLYRNSASGRYNLSQNNLKFEGLTEASSIRTNVCVISGSWQYEVTLHTSHPNFLRIGWIDVKAPLVDSLIGDAPHSFAIDGLKKKKITEKHSTAFGQYWTEGDVIGCCIKLVPSTNVNEISYYRNGSLLGVAFNSNNKLKSGVGFGYFAGLSVGIGQKVTFNFGSKPFEFPVPGFEPLQPPPSETCHSKLSSLLSGLNLLLDLNNDSIEVEIMIGNVLELIVSFLQCTSNGPGEYLITNELVPFLIRVMNEKKEEGNNGKKSKLERLLNYITSYWEEWEKEIIFVNLFNFLVAKCGRGFSLAEGREDYQAKVKGDKEDFNFIDSLDCLALITELTHHLELMYLFIHLNGGTNFGGKNKDVNDSKRFYEVMESLMCTKGLTQGDLVHILPVVYIDGCDVDHPGLTHSKQDYHNEIGVLSSRVKRHEGLIVKFLIQLFDFKVDVELFAFYNHSKRIFGSKNNNRQGSHKGGNNHRNNNKNNNNRRRSSDLEFDEDTVLLEGRDLIKSGIEYLIEKNELIDSEDKIGLSDPSVIFNCYFALLSLLQIKYNYFSVDTNDKGLNSTPYNIHFPGKRFFGTDYFGRGFEEQTRIGGTVSHLRKHFPIKEEEPAQSKRGNNHQDITLPDEMIEHLVTLFNYIVWKRYRLASLYRSSQTEALDRLKESTKQIEAMQNSNNASNSTNHEAELEGFKVGRLVFVDDAIEAIRRSMWHEIMLFTVDKQRLQLLFVSFLTRLIESYSLNINQNNIYHYIPQIYLETALNGLQGIVGGMDYYSSSSTLSNSLSSIPPSSSSSSSSTTSSSENENNSTNNNNDSNGELLKLVLTMYKDLFAPFLLQHLNDARIVNPEMRDLVLQSIALSLTNTRIITAFELDPFSNKNLMSLIISAFNHDKNNSANWVVVSAILPRFWQGTGFNSNPRLSSSTDESGQHTNIFRQRFVELSSEPIFKTFLNHLLNHLNWTFTELEVIMRELTKMNPNHTQHWVPGSGDGYRLLQRCGSFFELVVKLLRVVELVSKETPHLFLHDDICRRRILELLLYVLTRTTTGVESNVFESILALGASQFGLDNITRTLVLSPIVGTLVNLEGEEVTGEVIEMEMFKEEMMEYLIGFEQWSEEERKKVERIVKSWKERKNEKEREEKKEQGNGGGTKEGGEEEEEELCSICYGEKINVTFVPCKHRSCRRCIQRHMLESDKCFFCKAVIQKLDFD